MAEIPTRAGPVALQTTTTTIKTAGAAGTWVLVRSIRAVNVDTVARTVTVGTGTSNVDTVAKRGIASTMTILPGESIELIEDFEVLLGSATTPDLVYALCSANNAVNISMSGVEGP